ncbi:DUF805 domain-containing protein [Bacteroidales bacterium OttesenSCG-928-I21]|nr:DUF805 domain-containing protein [Bacteroidales bacterium OttesenSCG-928-I21]
MNDNYPLENFLEIIKPMDDSGLIAAYKNRNSYSADFVELVVEELGIRGYDATKIDEYSSEDIDIAVIKNQDTDKLIRIYYRHNKFKKGWDILAKNELKDRGIDIDRQPKEKTPMFKHCFSFTGRIRRLEFGLSFLICFVYAFAMGLFLVFTSANDDLEILMHILLLPCYWFILSQGTRRSHDLGHSGWWQLIPFYNLIILFLDGEIGINRYGKNPKGEGNFLA